MLFLKKNVSYHLSISTIFFFAFFVSIIVGSIQTVSATVPTDPASCAVVSGDCKFKYNAAGITWGMGCSDQTGGLKPVESGTCYSDAQVLPSEVPQDVVKICCIPSPPAGGTCASQGGSCGATCSNGEFTSVSGCPGVKCCKPDCTGTPLPIGCPGTPIPGASASIAFPNPLSGSANDTNLATTTVGGVMMTVLVNLQKIIVVLALVFIIIGAVLYIISAGDDGRMKIAKGAITASMIGLAVGIAAPSFLKQIADILKWKDVNSSTLIIAAPTLTALALKVLQFLLSIIGVLAIIMLVVGGVAYLTAGGDEERAGTGKKIVTYALIGISVALASLVIVTQVAKLFV